MVRMQVKNISSEVQSGVDLGSVVFANSYFFIDKDYFVSVTKNVPTFQSWHTSHFHYANTRTPILTEKNLECDQLGDKHQTDFYSDLIGCQIVR